MPERGRLEDTYVAALQHDLVTPPETALVLGVVRRPLPWLYGVVDENRPALAPPATLLDEFHDRKHAFETEGLDDVAAHEAAWDAVDYDRRYRDHLRASGSATEAIEAVETALAGGRDVFLVCYENTDEKRCHRTILREVVETRHR